MRSTVTSTHFLHLKLLILSLGESLSPRVAKLGLCPAGVVSTPFHEVILAAERRKEMGTKREVEPRRELTDG